MGHKPVSPYEFPLCTLQVALTNGHCRVTTHKSHVRSTQLGVCLAPTHCKVPSHKESPRAIEMPVYRAMSNILGLNFEKFIGAWQYKFGESYFFHCQLCGGTVPKDMYCTEPVSDRASDQMFTGCGTPSSDTETASALGSEVFLM